MKHAMIKTSLLLGMLLPFAPTHAAKLACDAIKEKITTKLEGKGVHDYTLKVISKNTETKHRVVGVCEGGSQKVIYIRKKSAKKNETADAEPKAGA
ncbi:DUF1161 domain-containing protein [Undibacterium rugosum]|uniref:DUF1161 domain-containing protein n=1 Tax=Undibacterium rugosum TaxID=2762291 RepID=A0A923KXX7_9BURK|nr:DUF1161 domain-containing protein [Undibacterium rugosum]MBC3933815.1 DUF1161 domain-containing protein [Undibacterium rugosum]MBR7777518.1 DUF1161 domain-containing protein [Undibacterium rugosum]